MRQLCLLLVGAMVALALMAIPVAAAPNCTINGTSGPDVFTAEMQTDGPDDICGLGGADVFYWSPGHDAYYGGSGRDTVVYAEMPLNRGMDIRLDLGHVDIWNSYPGQGSIIERDIANRLENVTGSGNSDFFSGNIAPNTFRGGEGDDRFFMDGVGDSYYAEAGNDDFLVGYYSEGAQPRRVRAGLGIDSIVADASADGVTVDMYARTFSSGDAVFEFSGMERVFGSQGPDTIQGDDGSNVIYGYNGDDTLLGGGGNDFLYGFNDVDYANGQAGALDECDAEVEEFCER